MKDTAIKAVSGLKRMLVRTWNPQMAQQRPQGVGWNRDRVSVRLAVAIQVVQRLELRTAEGLSGANSISALG